MDTSELEAESSANSGTESPVSPADIAGYADRLRRRGDSGRAREVLDRAIQSMGPRVELLWSLAALDLDYGDIQTGISRISEAAELEQSPSMAVARRISVLAKSVLFREALLEIEQLAESDRQHPEIRKAIGDFYELARCPAHAVAVSGYCEAKNPRTWLHGLKLWAHSGGLNWMRNRRRNWEEEGALRYLRAGARFATKFDACSGLTGSDATYWKALRDEHNFTLSRCVSFWDLLGRWAWRLRFAALLPSWLLFLIIAHFYRLGLGRKAFPFLWSAAR